MRTSSLSVPPWRLEWRSKLPVEGVSHSVSKHADSHARRCGCVVLWAAGGGVVRRRWRVVMEMWSGEVVRAHGGGVLGSWRYAT